MSHDPTPQSRPVVIEGALRRMAHARARHSIGDHLGHSTQQLDGSVACETCDLLREVARLRDLLDRDRTGLTRALNMIADEIESRGWLLEGRGPYEWNDDVYKDQAGIAMRACLTIVTEALVASGDLALAGLFPDEEKKP
jgi:hypothetical protein